MSKKSSTVEFIEKSIKIHGNKYTYELVDYVNAHIKVKIICSIHNIFELTPNKHLSRKCGCPKCGKLQQIESNKSTISDFINKANKIHSFKYNYSLSKYKSSHEKILILCNKHGYFKQVPSSHLNGSGCPKCSMSGISKPEIEISEMIRGLGYKVLNNIRTIIEPYELDIYIPDLNKSIEFNGFYWHYDKNKFRKGYHAMKSNMCREKGIRLLHVREELWLKNKENMLKIIKTFLEK